MKGYLQINNSYNGGFGTILQTEADFSGTETVKRSRPSGTMYPDEDLVRQKESQRLPILPAHLKNDPCTHSQGRYATIANST